MHHRPTIGWSHRREHCYTFHHTWPFTLLPIVNHPIVTFGFSLKMNSNEYNQATIIGLVVLKIVPQNSDWSRHFATSCGDLWHALWKPDFVFQVTEKHLNNWSQDTVPINHSFYVGKNLLINAHNYEMQSFHEVSGSWVKTICVKSNV